MKLLAPLLAFSLLTTSTIAQHRFLWQIGKPDNSIAEFAGAPNGGAKFQKDGVFVVGRSHESSDWPYAHPGPDDQWADSRQHSFSIIFGVKTLPAAGDSCRLQFRLADTHNNTHDKLEITVNGASFQHTLPRGSGEGIYGDLSKGKPYSFTIAFPSNLLHKGDNNITITTVAGSWFIYDWLGLSTPAGAAVQPVQSSLSLSAVRSMPFIQRKNGALYQTAQIQLLNTGEPGQLTVKVGGLPDQVVAMNSGSVDLDVHLPVVTKDSSVSLRIEKDKKLIAEQTMAIQPVRLRTVYILPHSHNDIGYTEIQPAVEKKQLDNLLKGIEYAQKTKDYPAGARFVWNLEGTYVADLFLQRMDARQKAGFIAALKDGGVALNGMYLNTLTGLCRPEELLRLFKVSQTLAQQTGTKVDAAMISDVPGYTWGTVTAMAQAGIRYFSPAPNYFDRIGDILPAWENKPFWWLSQSGKEKVLVWIPWKGYALSHTMGHPTAGFVLAYSQLLNQIKYPYEISYIRWSGHGDNAVPDPEISEFVKDWNQRYVYPHFIISSTSDAFSAFEKAYGDKLPVVQGDWTGYWEDGAASSALETGENRTSSSRLSQAGALWAMTQPDKYPVEAFGEAWRHVLLYSEHTWGADISVTNPLSQKTIEQWDIKKSYADKAAQLSQKLLDDAVASNSAGVSSKAANPAAARPVSATATPAGSAGAVQVFNTNSWTRTSLVLVPADLSKEGDIVKDEKGRLLPSQRLSTGELAFVADDVPAFAAKKYMISKAKGNGSVAGKPVQTGSNFLDNGIVRVTIDPVSGSVSGIRRQGDDNNFVDSAAGRYANDYLFLQGSNVADVQRNGQVTITVKEKGPVLSVLRIGGKAPGCNSLVREVTLVNGMDYVALTNIVDKQRAELNPHPGDYAWANTGGKESVNFGFPFHVTEGEVRLDVPFSVMRPGKDQIAGSCKNWLEAGRWADVSNGRHGITWVTLDAPLVEVGGITATLLGGQSNPEVWRKNIGPTQEIYSWAMNNHWETNYRAYQEGIVQFRYALRAHGLYDAAEASRFATGLTQPLVVAKATTADLSESRLVVSNKDIIVEMFKPSDDGKAFIVTLFNAGPKQSATTVKCAGAAGPIYYSNTGEQSLDAAPGEIVLAPWDVVTLRIER